MPSFFAVVGSERRGPYATIQEAIAQLKDISQKCGHTPEQAHRFFLTGSAIEQVETVGKRTECFRLGWMARERAGRLHDYSDPVCCVI